MPTELLKLIGDDSAAQAGGFSGGIFLTYTLNLTFYEQLVARELDKAGCANALIIADPDGYASALEMGAKTIAHCGRYYVCAPLSHGGRGVQHAKSLLMAGPQRGRLLIGSGNLTMHGYGRNLELFTHFEYDVAQPDPLSQYAFNQIWQLITRLNRSEYLPRAARLQVATLQERAPWLMASGATPDDFRILHNFETPLWAQIQQWRSEHGLSSSSLKSLRVISPYFDRDVSTLGDLTDNLKPQSVTLYVDRASTNLNGQHLQTQWQHREQKLEICNVETRTKKYVRPLHAKAIIGIEHNGAWCVSGSANLTHMALTRDWLHGGNLELVTFQWKPDPAAFDYLLKDETIHLRDLRPDQLLGLDIEPSERIEHTAPVVTLTELFARHLSLHGRVSNGQVSTSQNAVLHLLRSGVRLPVRVDEMPDFSATLPQPLSEAEAARLEWGDQVTPYRWIDQADVLAQFGERAYHARVRAKIETFDGANKLFAELLNFLWDRVDPAKITEESSEARLERAGQMTRHRKPDTAGSIPEPPPAAEFIADEELLNAIDWRVGYHAVYDRSTWSLRDLLSLVLLRLTTPTGISEGIPENGGDENESVRIVDEQKEQRIPALEGLRQYLVNYCRRYGRRLVDPEFVARCGPQLLFQNHFTLGRVLLEFARKNSTFKPQDLRRCFWWIWAPLVWPKIVGLHGTSAMSLLKQRVDEMTLLDLWKSSGLPGLGMTTMVRALAHSAGLRLGWQDFTEIEHFLAARTLIKHFVQELGNEAFQLKIEQFPELAGPDSIDTVIQPNSSSDRNSTQLTEVEAAFYDIATYQTPSEQKATLLRSLQELNRVGQAQSTAALGLIEQLHTLDPNENIDRLQRSRLQVIKVREVDNKFICPACSLYLPVVHEDQLIAGRFILCPNYQDAILYWSPSPPNVIVD